VSRLRLLAERPLLLGWQVGIRGVRLQPRFVVGSVFLKPCWMLRLMGILLVYVGAER
jgi:hypothetical protein